MTIMRCSYSSLNGRKTILQTSYGFLTTRKTVTKLTWERPAKKIIKIRPDTAGLLFTHLAAIYVDRVFDCNQTATYHTEEIVRQTNRMSDVNKTTGVLMSLTSTNGLSSYKLVRL